MYAKSMITSAVSDDVYQKIMDTELASDTWEALKPLYEAFSKDQVFKICTDFFSFNWSSSQDVSMHIAKLKSLWNDLNNGLKSRNEQPIPEVLLVCKTIQILPDQFENFKTSWMLLTKNEERSFDDMTNQLCMYERNFRKFEDNKEEQEALVVKTYKKGNNFKTAKKDDKKQDVCNYCKKKGHWLRDCRKWKADGCPSKNKNQNNNVSLTLTCNEVSTVFSNNDWWIDNGATQHVTNSMEMFTDFEEFKTPSEIRAAGSESLRAVGKGVIEITSRVNNKDLKLNLTDVWYVPGVSKNLFSVLASQDRNKNSVFISTTTKCTLKVNGEVILCGFREENGGLYKADIKPIHPGSVNAAVEKSSLQLYHERWGHQDKRHVKHMMENILGIKARCENDICEPCIYGKAHRFPFGTRLQATKPGELISTDVCGPFPASFKEKRYLVVYKDQFTKFRYGYFVAQKSEVKETLKNMIASTKILGHKIKELLSDNGGEFNNKDVKSILDSNGITQRLTAPYTPEQNGGSERENRTIVEMARTFMYSNSDIKFPDELWAEFTNSAIYILNRTGKSSVQDVSPYELWMGKKPRIKHLRIIGSTCFFHIPKQKRKKLDKKALKGYLVGYDGEEQYRIFNEEKKTVELSRDVIFNEKLSECKEVKANSKEKSIRHNSKNSSGSKDKIEIKLPFKDYHPSQEDTDVLSEEEVDDDSADITTEGGEEYFEISEDENVTDRVNIRQEKRKRDDPSSEENLPLSKRLRDRTIIKNSFYDDYVMTVSDFVSKIKTPLTYNEVLSSDEKEMWFKAMDSELNSLKENQTWEMAHLPKQGKALPCKWVFKVKTNPDGSIDKFKARLVSKGFNQRAGIDYSETFSPVAKMSTVRALLSIAASEEMHLSQFDVSTAFLYGELEEDIFMKQPEGFVCANLKEVFTVLSKPQDVGIDDLENF